MERWASWRCENDSVLLLANGYNVSQLIISPSVKLQILVKVTVQFETEGNGQNAIVSHMDR